MRAELHQGSIDDLLPAWESLFAADPQATPFVSPSWARAWWPHWAGSAQPWLVAVRDAGQLVGLAPLVIRRRGPLRILHALGEGPADYWDILAVPSAREAVVTVAAQEIVRRKEEWDALLLRSLPESSATKRVLADAGPQAHRRRVIPCPGIELPETFDEYLAALPRGRRGNLRRHLRRLDEGRVELREVRDPKELPTTVRRWQEIRVRRWEYSGRCMDPEHRSKRFHDFMRELVLQLVPAGLVQVWEFRHAGKVVSVDINLVDDRTFYTYLGGFEPSVARLGLGKISIAHSIRSSIAAGRSYYDFGTGDEPYKYYCGATDRFNLSLVFGNSRLRSHATVAAILAADRLRGRSRRELARRPTKQPSGRKHS